MTLAQAARLPMLAISGKPRNPSTVWRWCGAGVNTKHGLVRLAHRKIGGVTVVTLRDVRYFLDAVNADRTAGVPTTAAQAGSAHIRATKELAAAGIA